MKSHLQKIDAVNWLKPQTGILFLKKNWKKKTYPPIELHVGRSVKIASLARVPPYTFAELSGFYIKNEKIHFVLDPENFPHINFDKNKVYVAGSFNHWNESIGKKEWELQKHTLEDKSYYELSVTLESLDTPKEFLFKFVTADEHWLDPPPYSPNRDFNDSGTCNYIFRQQQAGEHAFIFEVGDSRAINKNYSIAWKESGHDEKHSIEPGAFFYQMESDLPLGAIINRKETTFRLFAPRAKGVQVEYFKNLNKPNLIQADLKLIDSCTWEIKIPKNLHGYYYYFRVSGINRNKSTYFDSNIKILDPYALATVNATGPGIIWDQKKLPKIRKSFTVSKIQDLVILECHVRDLTQNAPIRISQKERLGFKGLTKWLKHKKSYIRELGVNAIELQPIQQFDSLSPQEYHWGYMTTNYFSPCSHYALAPEKASQIQEFSELVKTAHKENLAVLVDVVYNHVGEPAFPLFIDKKYYFDLDGEDNLMNWSGCGNTLRCDTPMSRRLIIESLSHLIKTYDVDGFRFDLAELIGINVLKEIETELKKIKPSIILIAEPWSFRGHIARDLKYTEYSYWNDEYRNFLPKYVHGNESTSDGIRYFLSGSQGHLTQKPSQTINYSESHDDRCWLDKITENENFNGNFPSENDKNRTHLMLATLMSSLGVPMISQGQDMLRSKQGHNNTYLRGGINALDYARLEEHSDTHNYFKAWIQFRLSDTGKYLRANEGLSENYLQFFQSSKSSAIVAIINADFSKGNERLLFAVNPHHEEQSFELEHIAPEDWTQLANNEHFDSKKIIQGPIFETENIYSLAPESCELWIQKKQEHWN